MKAFDFAAAAGALGLLVGCANFGEAGLAAGRVDVHVMKPEAGAMESRLRRELDRAPAPPTREWDEGGAHVFLSTLPGDPRVWVYRVTVGADAGTTVVVESSDLGREMDVWHGRKLAPVNPDLTAARIAAMIEGCNAEV
ncbi:hypothetical protein ACQ5SO_07165 [Rhodovulum sp. DZ06]|uniref:hypothetical protein n=1 Tax=Rhodovulum sp. DZ06 TaxID=3425126 RepID=UPI003D350A60